MLGENEQAAAQAATLADPIGNSSVSDPIRTTAADFPTPNHNVINASPATGGPTELPHLHPGPAFVSDRSMSLEEAPHSPVSSVSGNEEL
jgi:hypothetical protein